MIEPLSGPVRDLFGLPAETADPTLIPLIASLREAISGMAEVDVTGVEPMSDLSLPRGWSSAVV